MSSLGRGRSDSGAELDQELGVNGFYIYCERVLGRALQRDLLVRFYMFRPPAPTVATGTADAERWSGRPRMVCAKGVRVPLGIVLRFCDSGEHRGAAVERASRGENRHFGLSPAKG